MNLHVFAPKYSISAQFGYNLSWQTDFEQALPAPAWLRHWESCLMEVQPMRVANIADYINLQGDLIQVGTVTQGSLLTFAIQLFIVHSLCKLFTIYKGPNTHLSILEELFLDHVDHCVSFLRTRGDRHQLFFFFHFLLFLFILHCKEKLE